MPTLPLSELLHRRAVYITDHTVARFRLHHPEVAYWADVVPALHAAEEISADLARTLLQRHPPPPGTVDGRYFLVNDHRGVFAGALPHQPRVRARALVIVTYLRFSPSQQELVDRLYPTPTEPT